MKPDDFEKRLQSQPLRQIPSEWRQQILANAASDVAVRPSLISIIHSQISALLWPSPKAWIGLAGVWVLIFAIQFESRNHTPMVAMVSKPSRTEAVITFKDQQKILAELMNNSEPRDVDRPRHIPNQPHSERHNPFSTV
jgi:hypothetical protein